MELKPFTPTQALRNRKHHNRNVSAENIATFHAHLTTFLSHTEDKQREGKQETDLRDFLNDAYYKNKNYINKIDTADWVIHHDNHGKDEVAVLIEVKSTTNASEMISIEKPNAKALHELVLYYLRERLDHDNNKIKSLIATNIFQWYIFDEKYFEEILFTPQLKKDYKDWQLSGKGTADFYTNIAKKHLENLQKPLECTTFDIRDYKKQDKKLTELHTILSPEFLLKQAIPNDANKLNTPFYNELLYILGIEERKDDKSNKKVIERLKPANRKEGSLLENTIEQLETKNALSKIQNIEAFGETPDEQKYSVALELCITWLNRLLFLKLLEGQIIKYHSVPALNPPYRGGQGGAKYKFLTSDKINDFDELGELFFGVLAKRPEDRTPSVQKKFGDIPYLNSSLFEQSNLEDNILSIELLKDRLEMPLFGSTILKDDNGKTRKGETKTLKYLLDFLDSYDFGSAPQPQMGELKMGRTAPPSGAGGAVNAAVLGLIFEKLNGYKDGSFFTPSFITMYMCHETLRRATIQKFNEANNWQCENFEALKEQLDDYKKPEKRQLYNDLINDIRVCDPAVGSGHFLVSALNEIIAIKAELNILQHPNGTRQTDYQIYVENDELVVWDEEKQQDFQYLVGETHHAKADIQRMQETLFYEKRTIIENCLFGVDINPKSVSICQLRLWIELLKNAFYTPESGYKYLETLPNIDINIKTGNSLVSKFALNEDLSDVFRTQKFSLKTYQTAVAAYKEAPNKQAKAELLRFITDIKEQFRQSVMNTDPRRKKLRELLGKRMLLDNNIDMFGHKSLDDNQLHLQKLNFDKQIKNLTTEIEDIQQNRMYRNAFEWRFEFPEVLDDAGNFVGFDVVVGNPPYFSLSKIKEYEQFFKAYETYTKSADIYCLFYEKSLQILNNQGFTAFITSNSWMKTQYGEPLRKFFLEKTNPLVLVNIEDTQVFDEATVESNILLFQKSKWQQNLSALVLGKTFKESINIEEYFKDNKLIINELDINGWNIGSQEESNLKRKIESNSKPLKDWKININFGIKTGFNEAFIIDEETKNKLILEDLKSQEVIKPILRGRDLKLYSYTFGNQYLINTHNGLRSKNIPKIDVENEYPTIFRHLKNYQKQLELRYDKGEHWSNLRNCAYLEDFDKPKIIWGELSDRPKFSFENDNFYAEATLFIMTGENLKYILAILNSKLSEWYFNQISTTTGMGTNRWKKYKIEQLPIKEISETAQTPFIERVEKILSMKKTGEDTTQLESEIDEMVMDLYELTAEEKEIVKGK